MYLVLHECVLHCVEDGALLGLIGDEHTTECVHVPQGLNHFTTHICEMGRYVWLECVIPVLRKQLLFPVGLSSPR